MRMKQSQKKEDSGKSMLKTFPNGTEFHNADRNPFLFVGEGTTICQLQLFRWVCCIKIYSFIHSFARSHVRINASKYFRRCGLSLSACKTKVDDDGFCSNALNQCVPIKCSLTTLCRVGYICRKSQIKRATNRATKQLTRLFRYQVLMEKSNIIVCIIMFTAFLLLSLLLLLLVTTTIPFCYSCCCCAMENADIFRAQTRKIRKRIDTYIYLQMDEQTYVRIVASLRIQRSILAAGWYIY